MATFVTGAVGVSVPATSANLGPGFDSLGLALDLRDELEAEVTGGGLVVEVTGPAPSAVPARRVPPGGARDAGGVRRDGRRTARGCASPAATSSRTPAGWGPRPPRSSAGVCLARAPGRRRHPADGRRRAASTWRPASRATPTTWPPPSTAGFVVSGQEAGEFYAVRSSVDPRVSAVVLVPPTPVSTELARGPAAGAGPARRRRGGRRPGGAAGGRAGRAARAPAARDPRLPAPGVPPRGDARVAGARRRAARRRRARPRVRRRPDRARLHRRRRRRPPPPGALPRRAGRPTTSPSTATAPACG